MLRISREKLTENNGKLYYEEKLFFGLVYCFDEKDSLDKILIVEQGIQIGISKDILDNEDNESARVRFEALELNEENSLYFYKNQSINGFVYKFDNDGFLFIESYYDRGEELIPSRQWFPSGALEESSIGREKKTWYENGQIKQKRVVRENWLGIIFSMKFDNEGRLNFLLLSNEYQCDLDQFNNMEICKKISIKGNGITDQVLNALFLCFKPSYAKLNSLSIDDDSKISKPNLVRLAHENMKTLSITGNKLVRTSLADEIMAKYPNCEIDFEEEDEDGF